MKMGYLLARSDRRETTACGSGRYVVLSYKVPSGYCYGTTSMRFNAIYSYKQDVQMNTGTSTIFI